MRKIILSCLSLITLLSLLAGCSTKKEEKNIDSFINKLVSAETYKNIDFNEDTDKVTQDLDSIYHEYLTDNGFDILISNRIPSIYYNVINFKNINNTTNIKITETKKTENDTYTHYEYEVSYKLNSDSESINVTDHMILKVNNDGLIDEVSVLNDTNSIFSNLK